MIKKFIDKLLGKAPPGAKAALGRRVELAQAEHGIDRSLLDANAVKVVQTLKEAGFEAYVVGGAVRDLLLGMRPKDFDVATDATPEQVKSLFRRAFIIGRRCQHSCSRRHRGSRRRPACPTALRPTAA